MNAKIPARFSLFVRSSALLGAAVACLGASSSCCCHKVAVDPAAGAQGTVLEVGRGLPVDYLSAKYRQTGTDFSQRLYPSGGGGGAWK